MLQLMDLDGAVALLGAVVRLWLKDARDEPEELAALAGWLGLTPHELTRRIGGRPVLTAPDPARWHVCPGCGQALPEHNQSEHGAGRRRLYCDDNCRRRAANARQKR